MATRDISDKFFSLRNSLRYISHVDSTSEKGVHAEDAPLRHPAAQLSGGADPESESHLWVESVDRVKQLRIVVRSRLAKLRELHSAHVKPQFNADEAAQEREIEALTDELKQLFREMEAAAKSGFEGSAVEGASPGPDEQKLLQNAQISVMNQIGELTKAFQQEQRKYLAEITRQRGRAKRLVSLGTSSGDPEEEQREKLMARYLEKGFTAEQIEALTFHEELINSRDAELSRIYQSIVDLHEIFKDMNALVIDQGTLLDRIDYNVEETRTRILSANREIKKTVEYSEKNVFLKLVVVLTMLILLMIGLLILKKI